MKKNSISIILPVHNGVSTLAQTLDCLQKAKSHYHQLIIINDGSADNSATLLVKFKDKVITNQKAVGLAASYNQAISFSTGDIILTLHQDIVFQPEDIDKLVKPLLNPNTVAAAHQVILPLAVWGKYNFWQKLFFARKVNLLERGIDGKFDAFNKSALIEVGLFDSTHFHSAGEDGDIIFKLKKFGRIIQTTATITHLHQQNDHFSLFEIFRKQAQYSQAQGTLLRLGRYISFPQFIKTFFREILILGLLIPNINKLFILLIIYYSVSYSLTMFTKTKLSARHFLIPVINLSLLFVSLLFSLQGFLQKKQTL